MIELRNVYQYDGAEDVLYALLGERIPSQSISHQYMPTIRSHKDFVRSHPYRAWYLILAGDDVVGSIYLTKNREIGVFVFKKHQRHGYGSAALTELMQRWPGRFLANINPLNESSIGLFQRFGFKHIQNTYAL
jgi:RimJ/RimL family protein N-acetyltransferase